MTKIMADEAKLNTRKGQKCGVEELEPGVLEDQKKRDADREQAGRR